MFRDIENEAACHWLRYKNNYVHEPYWWRNYWTDGFNLYYTNYRIGKTLEMGDKKYKSIMGANTSSAEFGGIINVREPRLIDTCRRCINYVDFVEPYVYLADETLIFASEYYRVDNDRTLTVYLPELRAYYLKVRWLRRALYWINPQSLYGFTIYDNGHLMRSVRCMIRSRSDRTT